MGKKEPKHRKPVPENLGIFPEACDRCGHTKLKDEELRGGVRVHSHRLFPASTRLADAQYEIIIERDSGEPGFLYLCGHHYRQHEAFIASRGYEVREWG